uniref:Uncharacterized protein n=1 Tax=Melopsittacus undulatus TaxID=13146 RepID=A0A8C6JEP6_MELUD
MIYFIVLALCCSFFSSRATPLLFEFSDCDDPDVFKAVDAALKKYNGDIATGNQFALHMVMEAKRTFYVKYRIRETTCATEEKKLWQDCDYKVSAEAEKLKPGAVLHEVLFLFVLFCFAATPKITLTQATCLGCFHPISSDSSVVLEILKQAIQKFNKHSGEPALFKLVEIKEATRQVVAGWNYAIKYEIEETNCSKDQFQDLTPECKTTSRGEVIVDIASQCKLPGMSQTVIPATQTGCPKTVANDNPELKELLKVSMEKYNSESNDDFYYKSGEIQAATVQVGIYQTDEEQTWQCYWSEHCQPYSKLQEMGLHNFSQKYAHLYTDSANNNTSARFSTSAHNLRCTDKYSWVKKNKELGG